MKYCGLREKWREEYGVARRSVLLLLQARVVAGSTQKENFHNRDTDLVAICGKSNINLEGNNRR